MNLENIIASDYSNTTGIIVLKNGETIHEEYYNNYSAESTFHVFSVTKTIVSVLIGIAIDKGFIKSVEQRVLDFFPDYVVKRGEKTIQNITIKDIITMTAPYKYKYAPYTKFYSNEDWVKASLDLLGGKGEVGKFRYTPLIGPDILSGILVSATGQSVLDFARENLFAPLGISVEGNIVLYTQEEHITFVKTNNRTGWVADERGTNTTGWGLTLTINDMAKIGQLYLNGGTWNNKQIVSKSWVKDSTREHSRWEEMSLSYGYLWWLDDKKSGCYMAMGDGGNVIYINPQKQLVVAIAATFKPRAKDRIEFIKRYIDNE